MLKQSCRALLPELCQGLALGPFVHPYYEKMSQQVNGLVDSSEQISGVRNALCLSLSSIPTYRVDETIRMKDVFIFQEYPYGSLGVGSLVELQMSLLT